ncbi:hypothetical protein BKA63DRAFT_62823 [Paraphoma chrysanthemicola]|nr:hypothetical protein BKA63DRAFT_62823 [Paraphoma chrysanthemicola]
MRPRRVTPSVSFAPSVESPSAFDPTSQGCQTARRLHADSCCTLPLLVEMDSARVVAKVNSPLVNGISASSIRRTQIRVSSGSIHQQQERVRSLSTSSHFGSSLSAVFTCFYQPRLKYLCTLGFERTSHASLQTSSTTPVCVKSRLVHPRHNLRPHLRIIMAASHCQHSWQVIKSDTTLIQWNCHNCHSGPHSFVYECKNCKIKTCQPCTSKA